MKIEKINLRVRPRKRKLIIDRFCLKMMILISPVIFLPLVGIATLYGINEGLILFGLITYTVLIFKTLSN